jgi:hypothetical protein
MSQRRYALITGASSGIGAAFARLAAQKGFDVGLAARRKERLAALAEELQRSFGARADVFEADLARAAAAEGLAAAVHATGRKPAMLVNNAGFSVAKGFAGASIAEQDSFLELTIRTPMALARLFLPSMLERGWGRIINVSSITALSSGGKGHTLYPAGKAFLLKFSQSLAAEVAARGVHVTAVLPGFVNTEFQEAIGMAEAMKGSTRRFAQSAAEVATEAFARNDKGVEIVVPGLMPKFAAAFLRYTPEICMRALTRPAAAKYYVGD